MLGDAFRSKIVAAGGASGTDKISNHHYENSYCRLLAHYENSDELSILEIGYGSGSGVKFWREVFPNAFVYCLDRDIELAEQGVQVIRADQSSLESLGLAASKIQRPVSVIIDDGSHHPSHQLMTFSEFFPRLLAPNGTYIIEDIETSYWRRGSIYGYEFNYGLNDPWSLVEAFKVAADYVNRRYLSLPDRSLIEYKMISVGLDPSAVELADCISFSRNLVAITKQGLDQIHSNGDYPFSQLTDRFPA
jgi:hypothetical protein